MLGRSQLGEEVLPGVLTVLRTWRLAGTGPCTSKKNSGPAAASADIAGAAAGVRSNTFIVPLILSRIAHSAASNRPLSLRRRTRAQPHGLTPLPGISQRFAGRGSSHRSVIALRVPKPLLPGPPGPVARDIASRFGDEQRPGTLRRGSPGWGTTGSGASAGSGPQRRRRLARPAFRYQGHLFFPLLLLEAVRLRPGETSTNQLFCAAAAIIRSWPVEIQIGGSVRLA